MAFWLLKTEPSAYSFGDLVRDGRTAWTGVANPVAQRNLRAMRKGDRALVYHTGDDKAAVGVAEVVKEAYPDPGERDPRLACVDVKAVEPLSAPVTLATLKAHPAFAESPLVKQGRLSVVPLTAAQWKAALALARRGGASGGPAAV
jgi:predicted RNA-binding protein with PUA-like domain